MEVKTLHIKTSELVQAIHTLNDNGLFWILFGVIIADFLTGTLKAFISKDLDSSAGTLGLIKHICVILIVVSVSIVGYIMNNDFIAYTFITFYLFEYTLSIIENLNLMGIPFPDFVENNIRRLKETQGKEYDEKKKGGL